MKKIFLILLALSLCSCTRAPIDISSSHSEEKTEILLACPEEYSEIESLTKAFEKENPEIKISIIKIDSDDDFAYAIKALFSGTHTPTLVFTEARYLNELSDNLLDLSDELWTSNAIPNSLFEFNREGEILAMPAEIEGIGFVYNRKVIETAGINPENINSVERLAQTAEYLSKKLPELKEKHENLKAVFSAPDEQTERYLVNAVVSQHCSSPLEEIDPSLSDGFKALLDLQYQYGEKTPEEHSIITLKSHKSSCGSWEDFDILPIPVLGASQDSIILNVPTCWALNKAATKSEQTAAKEFLLWIYTSETGSRIISEKLGWLSPFDNTPKIPDTPVSKTVRQYALSAKTMPYVLNGIDEEAYDKIRSKLNAPQETPTQ